MSKQLKLIFGYFGQNIFIKIISRAYLYIWTQNMCEFGQNRTTFAIYRNWFGQ